MLDELVRMEILVHDEYDFLIVYLEVLYFTLEGEDEAEILDHEQEGMDDDEQERMALLDEVQERQIQVVEADDEEQLVL